MFAQLIADYENALQPLLSSAAPCLLNPPELEHVQHPLFESRQLHVDVLRCDSLHPVISGNKWYKLKFNLLWALTQGVGTVRSFGGAWSNHLHALAYCARQLGLHSEGIVRGEELHADSNAMLQDARDWGMGLSFVDRIRYREMTRNAVQTAVPGVCSIPEGGDNWLGVLGCMTLVPRHLALHYDRVVVAVGTGCTLAGLCLGLPARVQVTGVSALKGQWQRQALQQRLQRWWPLQSASCQLLTGFHCGGYGKVTSELLSFIQEFGDNTGLPLDPVYTGKAMFALCHQVQHNCIPSGSRVLFIHSGGLQGARGYHSFAGNE